jgi:hypothetical protein
MFSGLVANAADDCSRKTWSWKVDKQAALDLQHSVNSGHQPWRMGDVSTLATEAIDERKLEWSDVNIVSATETPENNNLLFDNHWSRR